MDAEIARREEADRERFFQNLKLLGDHYELASGPAFQSDLLFALLRDHVPAFRESRGPGAGKFWTDYRLVLLFAEVKTIVATGATQAAALRKLANLPRFENNPPKSLEKRLGDAKKTVLVKFFEDMAAERADINIWPDVIKIAEVSLPNRE